MAANTTGHKKTDHLRIMGLAEAAAQFAREILAPCGAFVAKVFQGGTENQLLADLKRDFATVRHVKPQASRADSSFQQSAQRTPRCRFAAMASPLPDPPSTMPRSQSPLATAAAAGWTKSG